MDHSLNHRHFSFILVTRKTKVKMLAALGFGEDLFLFLGGCLISMFSHGGGLRRRPAFLGIFSVGGELSHHHHHSTSQRQYPLSVPTLWESGAACECGWIRPLSSSGQWRGEVEEIVSRWVRVKTCLRTWEVVGKHCTLYPSNSIF